MKANDIKIASATARQLQCILAASITALLGLSGLAQGQDQFWDGSNTQPNNMVDGGSGTWDSTTTNWTTATGNVNSNWVEGANAFFQAVPGTVTVAGGRIFNSLRFEVNGYQIVAATAGILLLPNLSAATITTDPGVTATISAPLATNIPIPGPAIASAGGFTKEGAGTLVLSGANTYFGSTAINAGTLSISNDANLGKAPSTVVPNQLTFDNGATLQATANVTLNTNRGITLLAGGGTIEVTGANTLSYAGSISGTGNLTKVGTGTLVLHGSNPPPPNPPRYTGKTFVNDGTLTLLAGANTQHNIIIGPLIIGDDMGAPARVIDGIIGDPEPKMGVNPRIPVTVNSDGQFVVNVGSPSLGQGEGIGQLVINRGNVTVDGSLLPGFMDPVGQPLEMNGGSISGGGTLVLPNVTATSDASGEAATISANAKLPDELPDASRVLTVNDGPGSPDLLISGVIFPNIPHKGPPIGITKEGTGTLVLNGANTYTGITAINAGVLSISSDGNLGIAPGARVANQLTFNGGTLQATASFTLNPNRGITLEAGGGTIDVTGANTLSYAGLAFRMGPSSGISGTGNLTKVGTGTLTLAGRNTYTGTTFVNEGTLTLVGGLNGIQNQNSVILGPLIIGDDIGATNPAIVIDSGAFGTIGGPNNNNSTPVTVNSDGLLRVDVNEEIHDALVINRGIVSVTKSFRFNTLQMIGGSISGGREIDLDDSLTATSDASGNPATISSKVKILTTIVNTFSKVFTINDGPGSTDLLISGVISQDPSATKPVGITKEGTGTLVLSGKNTYTGATTVNGGNLIVDGSIASAETFVNAGGLLGGNGSLGRNGSLGGNLTNSGFVSPGHSPGTLTVNGNYTQTANGTLHIEIAGTALGQFDLLAVGIQASLAGTLQPISLHNFQLQVGNKITFLTAGRVTGTFGTIQNPFISNTLVKAEIIYLPTAVQLEGTQGSFTQVACNPNTVAVGGALNSAVGDPRASGLIDFLDTQPLFELCGDFELIAPEELPAVFNVSVSLANIQTVNLERRMYDIHASRSSGFSSAGLNINGSLPNFSGGLAGPTGPEGKSGPSVMLFTPENRWGVWVTGLGDFNNVGDTSNARGFDLTTGGLTFGADYLVSPNFAIGLTGGYANTNADLGNNGSLDVNGGIIGAYATGFGGGFYVNAAAFGIFNGYDSHRTALLGTASGNTDGQDFNAFVEAGYDWNDWKHGGLTIGPLASFQYTYVGFDGFTEHGSVAPLTFSNQNAESTRTALGAKASYDWHVGHVVVRPELRAAWQHEFGDTEYSIVSRLANGAGNSFTVNGPAIGRDSLLIGAGAAVLLNDRVSVYAYYDGELARTNYSSNNVSAGMRITF